MVNDCFIKNWLEKYKSWLFSLFCLSFFWVIGIILIAWFTHSKYNKFLIGILGGSANTSDAINLGMLIGAIISIFIAFFQYKQQRQKEFIQDNRTEIIKLSLRSITKLDAKYNLCFKLIKGFIEEEVVPVNNISRIKDAFMSKCDIWLKDIRSLVKLTNKIRNFQTSHTSLFPELNLFGVSQEDLQELSNCIAETIKCTNSIQNSLHKVSSKIEELKDSMPESHSEESNSVFDVFLSKQNDTCKAKAKELIDLLGNSINNPSFERAFNKLMELGNKIIKP